MAALGTKRAAREERSVLVVRHGQSTTNAEGRWAGDTDPPLTALGFEQARGAALALADRGLAAVTSSPLQRARSTAETIAAELGLPLLDPLPDLRERNAGLWAGLTGDEVEARWPGRIAAYRAGHDLEIPGAPPWQEFAERVLRGVRVAAERAVDGPLLVVAHGGVLFALYRELAVQRNQFSNLSGSWLRVCSERVELGEGFEP